jgi:hypothetical protein
MVEKFNLVTICKGNPACAEHTIADVHTRLFVHTRSLLILRFNCEPCAWRALLQSLISEGDISQPIKRKLETILDFQEYNRRSVIMSSYSPTFCIDSQMRMLVRIW